MFKNLSASKNNAHGASYKVALGIGKHGKPFTDRDYMKADFLDFSEVFRWHIKQEHYHLTDKRHACLC